MFSATDIASFLACQHTATLDRAESRKEITKPFFEDPAVELLRKLGLEHEQRYLRELAEGQLSITESRSRPWAIAVAQTIEALREGVDVVYQAAFLDRVWGGRPDFLIRVDRPQCTRRLVLRGRGDQTRTLHESGRASSALLLLGLAVANPRLEPQRMHVVLGGGAAPEQFQFNATSHISARSEASLKRRGSLKRRRTPNPRSTAMFALGSPSATNAAGMTTTCRSSRESLEINGRRWWSVALTP